MGISEAIVSVPLRGVGCFAGGGIAIGAKRVSVPLRGVGCFLPSARLSPPSWFPSPCGVWVVSLLVRPDAPHNIVSVPLRGVGCFNYVWYIILTETFPSPCGVWVVSLVTVQRERARRFPSPCGVWVVSTREDPAGRPNRFRPLAGCGLFRQSCTFFLVQQEKELSTLLFYCIILADVYQ